MTRPPVTAPGPLAGLLAGDPSVIDVGLELFDEALRAQGVPARRLAWRPPAADAGALARIAADPRRRTANEEAVRRLAGSRPLWVGMATAGRALGLSPGQFLHAGPPITWERASGPLRGALIGALLHEGLAATPDEAVARAEAGDIELSPCHHHGAVGPMAGVVSPSMPVMVVEDEATGRRAHCTLNEGLGRVLRYGAYDADVLARLGWLAQVAAPALTRALDRRGPVELRSLMAQALHMGDELHNRNRAATSLLVRELVPALVETAPAGEVADLVRFLNGNDHFFLNLAMAAGKVAADGARDLPGATVVVAMARNGTDFGIQVSGTGDRWFTAPAAVPDGLYLGSYGPDDANPDIGDSTITETVGLGGFAMAAAPAIVRFVGGRAGDAVDATRRMYEIAVGEHPHFQVPVLDFRGTPLGIDATRVVRTGLVPSVNTGIAGRVAGTGQVGAGVVEPPMACFAAAVEALAVEAPAFPTP